MIIDRGAAEEWVRAHAKPIGAIELVHERPWATVLRVPVDRGVVWFKACASVQAFEPRLTAELYDRWPDRVTEVLGHDDERGWLLLGDAGAPVGDQGNPPEVWLSALPLYAELQHDEAAHAKEHLAVGVPDMRLATLPAGYEELLQLDLPLEEGEVEGLRRLAPRFAGQCDELATFKVPETIQHDDLHHMNLYAREGCLRVLDWGDSSIAHPFFSLVVTFRFLEERTGLAPGNPWFARLRDAYLEPWDQHFRDAVALAIRVGHFARAISYPRVRAALSPAEVRAFDRDFATVLRRALAQVNA